MKTRLTYLLHVVALGGCVGSVGMGDGRGVRDDVGRGAAGASGGRSEGGGSQPGAGAGGRDGAGGSGGPSAACAQQPIWRGRAPLRRLTRFEYDNTVRDLLGDETSPAAALPADESGNGFGNDADALSVSSLLAEQYGKVAEGIAARATRTPELLSKLSPCASQATAATADACARITIENFTSRAYRRPLVTGEIDELSALERGVRAKGGFAAGIAAVIEAVLQSPDFLYRIEWGAPDPARPSLRRPTGDEMAVRLSYLFWATMPDERLRAAARAGELVTKEGVLAEASRLLADRRARPVIRFFFDNYLPLAGLADSERDKTLFPGFSPAIGALMREETQRLLEHEIFESGKTWTSVFTAPYTFVNGPLAAFYGMPGVTGEGFAKVPLDTSRRLGLLTQASVMVGTTHSNVTNPVVRGSFVVQKLLCREIPLPAQELAEKVKPPDPYSGKTGRDRYSQHSRDPVCAGCHQFMDPLGFALENFDPVGSWRDQENGVTIDASGALPGGVGSFAGPVELARRLADAEETKTCFVANWLSFAYGRTLGAADACVKEAVELAFAKAGHDVRQLLLALTQTDAFLYLPAP